MEKEDAIREAADRLDLSQILAERLRESSRHDGPEVAVLPPRQAPPAEVRERRFLAMAMALPREARPFLESLSPDAFEGDGHREVFLRIRAGAASPDDLPESLDGVATALRVELADAAPTPDELSEAAYRVQLPWVERQASERRAAGDEEGRLRYIELARRVRAALRGER